MGSKDMKDIRDPSVSTPHSKIKSSSSRHGIRTTTMVKNEYRRSKKITRYSSAAKTLIPFRSSTKLNDDTALIDNAGLFSTIFSSWLTKYLWKSYREGISLDDLPKTSPFDTCNYNVQRLELLWNEEVVNNGLSGASFARVGWRFIRTRIFLTMLVLTLSIFTGFAGSAVALRKLLEFVESPDGRILTGILWVSILLMLDLMKAGLLAWSWNLGYRTSTRFRCAYVATMYRKLIRTNSLGNSDSGKFINMMATDGAQLYDFCLFVTMLCAVPLTTILIVAYVAYVLSLEALLGLLSFVFFYPLQYLVSRCAGYYRRKSIKVTDQRISAINEILDCIKLIKMYAWEESFTKNLIEIRKREKMLLEKATLIRAYGSSFSGTIPIVCTITTFLAHVAGGHNLTASQVFPFVLLLNTTIRHMISFFEIGITSVINSRISFSRMKSVMVMDETKCLIHKPILKSQALSIINGTFVCDFAGAKLDLETKKKKKKRSNPQEMPINEMELLLVPTRVEILSDITFEAEKEKLIGICGNVGSGKTSLLKAALGQLRIISGKLSRDGTCAYVSQQAWILNATMKENIIFGHEFDPQRYYSAINLCCLQDDLDRLPAGDETEIGERGINLSGGQKQRVALARAYYANRDIYFLDDPLSAVDINVGKYIFKNLIEQGLEDKTVILVTHQIPYLSRCDEIYVMNNGRIVEHGDHMELIQAEKDYAMMVKIMANNRYSNSFYDDDYYDDDDNDDEDDYPESEFDVQQDDVDTVNCNGDVEKKKNDGRIIEPETVQEGSIKYQTFSDYIMAMGGYASVFFTTIPIFLSVACIQFTNWWLATWIHHGSGGATIIVNNQTVVSKSIIDNPNLGFYETIYACCIAAIMIANSIRAFVITRITLKASTKMHNNILKKIMFSSMQFFETTPRGRLQNIFTRDMSELDVNLPMSLNTLLFNFVSGPFNIIVICIIYPYLTLPFFGLAILCYYLTKIFRVVLRDMQRLESVSRAPILSHTLSTLQGLDIIHAFRKESEFIQQLYKLVDLNETSSLINNFTLRWAAIRFDSLMVIAYSLTGITVVLLKGRLSPALAGLALTFCGQMAGLVQFTIRLLSQTELKFISVERVGHYLRTLRHENENTKTPTNLLEDEWPVNGAIELKAIEMKYRKNLPTVLNRVSFRIEAGEKFGIVGQTGSGKSSLIVALFRMVELSAGTIEIDGVDTSRLNLNQLRSKLSIIPQEPMVFSGTIRFNLDPMNLKTDDDLWTALEKCKLKMKVLSMHGQLNAVIDSSGTNLSVGECQLLCLARVLLRKNKILILDEATASVDPQTEAIVQATLQDEFSNCTILTIAHRLQTILSYDRVVVMNAGNVIEIGSPSKLLDDSNTEFSKMLATADRMENRM